MHMTKLNWAVLGALTLAGTATAADINGYTAKYERDLGPIPTQCDQVIKPGDAWSKITGNSGDDVFCLAPGDHTGKGTLTLGADGTESRPKWLMVLGDSNKHPVKQSASERAVVRGLEFNGASWWNVYRVSFDGKGRTGNPVIQFSKGSNAHHNTLDHILLENAGGAGVLIHVGNDNNAIQNSVVRDFKAAPGSEPNCVHLKDGPDNTRIVNNEMYSCTKSVYLNEFSSAGGTIMENNDFYVPKSDYTDCNGRYTTSGTCSSSKAAISLKSGGTASNPVRIFKNRIWGVRLNDKNVCCTALSSGHAVSFSNSPSGGTGNARYVYFENNIVMDSHTGVAWTRDGTGDNKVVGNIFYQIRRFNKDPDRNRPSHAINKRKGTGDKVYFNTIIDTDRWLNLEGGATNSDIRCNAIFDSGSRDGGSNGSGTHVHENAFFGTPATSVAAQAANVTGSTADSLTEGFSFYRKLWTGPEKVTIPHALPTFSSPHYAGCTGNMSW